MGQGSGGRCWSEHISPCQGNSNDRKARAKDARCIAKLSDPCSLPAPMRGRLMASKRRHNALGLTTVGQTQRIPTPTIPPYDLLACRYKGFATAIGLAVSELMLICQIPEKTAVKISQEFMKYAKEVLLDPPTGDKKRPMPSSVRQFVNVLRMVGEREEIKIELEHIPEIPNLPK